MSDDERLKVVKEADMKSVEGKKRWREFMMPFDGKGAPLLERTGSSSGSRCDYC